MSSSNVETRILQMKWDARDFESAAKNTLKLLDEVKNHVIELNQSMSNGFGDVVSGISKKATGHELDTLNDAAQKVGDSFTLMGRIAYKALDQIAEKTLDVAKKVGSDLFVKPITQGFDEYGLLMDSTQVIIANTGRSLEDVDSALEQLNKYADKTIYNFSHMTSAIGKFSAAGVGLEDSVAAIEGLSNLSALVGASAQNNSVAMEAVSRALAAGRLTRQQWISFRAAGSLGGKTTKNAFIEAAKELGIFDQDWANGTGKSLSGADILAMIDDGRFEETLSYGWLTNDVIMRGLAKFSDETTELGQRAAKAATEVRTFKKMVDALQEAAQSSWSESFKYIFGNYEEGTAFWTAVNDEVSKYIGLIGDARNAALRLWHDNGGREALLSGLSTLYQKVKTEATSMFKGLSAEIFSDWFGRGWNQVANPLGAGSGLIGLSKRFKEWAENLTFSEKRLDSIRRTLTLIVFQPLHEIKRFIDRGGVKAILDRTVDKLGIILNLAGALQLAIHRVFAVWDPSIQDWLDPDLGIGTALAKYEKAIAAVFDYIEKETSDYTYLEGQAGKWQAIFENILIPVQKISETLNNVRFADLVAIGTDLYDIVTAIAGTISQAIATVSEDQITTRLANAVHEARTVLDDIKAYVESAEGQDRLVRIWTGVLSAVQLVFGTLYQIITSIFPSLKEGTGNVATDMLDILAAVGDWFTNLENVVSQYELVKGAMEVIKAFFAPFVGFLERTLESTKGLIESIFGFSFDDFLTPAVWEQTEEGATAVERFAISFNNNLDSTIQKVSEFSNKVVMYLDVVKRTFFFLADIINKDNWIGNLLRPLGRLFDLFKNADYSPLMDILVNLADIVGTIGTAFTEAVRNIFKFDSETNIITETLKLFAEGVGRMHDALTSDFAFTVIKRGLGSIVSLYRLVYDFWTQLVSALNESGWIDAAYDAITPFAKILGGLGTYFGDLVRWIEQVVRKEEIIKKFFMVVVEHIKVPLKYIESFGEAILNLIHTLTGADISKGNFFSRFFGPPRKHIENLGNTLGSYFDSIYAKMTGTAVKAKDVIEETADETVPVIEEQHSAMEKVVAGFTKGLDDMKKGAGGTKDWLKEQWTSLFGQESTDKVSKSISEWWAGVKSYWTVASEENVEEERGMFAKVTAYFSGMADKIGTSIKEFRIGNVWDWFKSKLFGKPDETSENGTDDTGIIDWIKGKIAGIRASVQEWWETNFKDHESNFWLAMFGGKKDPETGEVSKGLAGTIGAIFDDAIARVKEKLAGVKTKFQPIIDFFKPLFEQLKEIYDIAVFNLKDFFSDKWGVLTLNSIFERFKQFVSVFGEIQLFKLLGGLGDTLSGVGKVLKKFSKRVKKLADQFVTIFENVGKLVETTTEGIKTMLGNIGGSFKTIASGFDKFLNTTLKGTLDNLTTTFDKFANKTLKKLSKQWTKALKPVIKGAGKFMKDTGKGIKRYLTGKAINEVATALLKFAIAVGILAAALYGLSLIPTDQLKKGGLVLGAIMAALLGVAAAIILLNKGNKSDKGGNPLEGASAVLKGFGGGVEIMKDAVGEMVEEFQKALSNFAKIGIIVAFVAAVKTVIDGVVKIGQLDPEQAMMGIVGVITALGAVTIALVALFKSADGGSFKVRQILAMFALIMLIKTGVDSVLKIGGMSWEEMARGVLGISVLLIALSVTMAIMFRSSSFLNTDFASKTTTTMKQVFMIVAVCLAIHTLGNAVVKIGKLPTEKIIAAGACIGLLMGVFTVMMAFLYGSTAVSYTTVTDILAMVAACIAISTLAGAVKKIAKLDTGDSWRAMVIIGGLMALFGLTIKFASEMTGKGLLAILLLSAAVAGLVYALDTMAEEFSKEKTGKFKMLADALAEVLLAFGVTLGVVAMVGKFAGAGGVLTGIVGLVGVIVAVVAVLAVIGTVITAIDSLTKGGATKVLNKGMEIMEALGGMIGGFVGNLVGKFKANMAKHMESTGTSLSNFITNAKPFLDAMKDPKALQGVTKSIGTLADAILKLTAADLIKRFDIFGKNDNPFQKFVDMLDILAPALVKYNNNVKDIDTDKVSKTITAMGKLIEASAQIPNQGGKIAEIFGDNTLTDFAKGLADFTPAFGDFLTKMEAAGLAGKEYKKVDNAIEFAGKVAEFAKKIPNQGGSIANIFGDNTLTDFATGIADFTPAFGGFLTAMKEQGLTEGDNSERVQLAIDFANKVSEFARSIPNEGLSVSSVIFGDNSLSDFAQGLADFTPAFGGFLTAMKDHGLTEGDNSERVQKAIDFANGVVDFANKIETTKEGITLGGIGIYSQDALSTFAEGLTKFTPAFTGFLTEMRDFDYGDNGGAKISQAIRIANAMVRFVNNIPETKTVSLGDFTIFTTNRLSQFADGLTRFTPSFSTFLTEMGGLDYSEEKVQQAIQFAEAAAQMAEKSPRFGGLKEWWDGNMNLTQFGKELAGFAPFYKTYLETLGSATYDEGAVEKSAILMESLTGIVGAVNGKESDLKKFFIGDSSLAGIGEGLNSFATAMGTYSSNLQKVDWEKAEQANEFILNISKLAENSMEVYNAFLDQSLQHLVSQLEDVITQFSPKVPEEFTNMVNDQTFQTDMDKAGKTVGTTFTGGIQSGFNGSIFDVTGAIEKHIRVWLETEQTNVTNKLTVIAAQVSRDFIDTVTNNIGVIQSRIDPEVTGSINTVMDDGVNAIDGRFNDFYVVASNCMQGLINGIRDRENEVYTELDNLAAAMVATTQAGVQVESPSKIFAWIGGNLPLGLAKGVKDKAPEALTALKEKLVRPINNMAALLNGDLEYSPKIRPVVELDGARASVNNLNNMFGSETLRMAESTIRVTNDNALAKISKNKTYNDRNVLRAINGLQGDVVNLNSAIRNMGIYLNDDTLVGGIVDKVDKKLGSNQIRRRRFA